MIWRVILFWLFSVSLALGDLPRHGASFSLPLPATVIFQYNFNGNLTSDGTRSFYYDAENRLTNEKAEGSPIRAEMSTDKMLLPSIFFIEPFLGRKNLVYRPHPIPSFRSRDSVSPRVKRSGQSPIRF